jgi:2-polyprenyl-6-methoxyphenol hydroxylase-like FAD-dependent oxidoreductase
MWYVHLLITSFPIHASSIICFLVHDLPYPYSSLFILFPIHTLPYSYSSLFNLSALKYSLPRCSPDSAGYEKLSQADQIAAIRKHLLSPAVPNSPIIQRALNGLSATSEVYMEYSGQIKAKHLSTPGGRIGMIGDAAYCGTAVTGAGTTLSLVGAYVLAGELARHADAPKEGFQAYEAWMSPFAAAQQSLPPGVPQIFLPQTEFGISVLHRLLATVLWLSKIRAVQWVAGRLFLGEVDGVALPDYREFEVGVEEK